MKQKIKTEKGSGEGGALTYSETGVTVKQEAVSQFPVQQPQVMSLLYSCRFDVKNVKGKMDIRFAFKSDDAVKSTRVTIHTLRISLQMIRQKRGCQNQFAVIIHKLKSPGYTFPDKYRMKVRQGDTAIELELKVDPTDDTVESFCDGDDFSGIDHFNASPWQIAGSLNEFVFNGLEIASCDFSDSLVPSVPAVPSAPGPSQAYSMDVNESLVSSVGSSEILNIAASLLEDYHVGN